ncbi:hypothetical protein J132_09723 [Termitomyces sp. J132]|nr:hypothetical protein J132_09723 [Termitomyces sp. J132]
MRTNTSNPPLGPGACLNLDGAVRDEDTFVLGDDNSANEDEKDRDTALFLDTDTLTSTQNAPQNGAQGLRQEERPTESKTEEGMGSDISESFPSPLKYYILQSDTLQGIVLRFGLDGREVCRLNNLPSSTLRTTPHLLHTRRYLILPPSARKAGLPVRKEPPEEVAAREVKWRKERAEKRLQTLMKEADWYVAKAYVALADDPVEEIEEQEDWDKIKEYGDDVGPRPTNLEERAIRKYLDDDEWEATQRERASGIPALPGIDLKRTMHDIVRNENHRARESMLGSLYPLPSVSETKPSDQLRLTRLPGSAYL